MASFKELSMSRPIPQAGVPVRQGNSRHHSHSVSLGAVNPNHRVTRRKSVTTAAAVHAAVAVAASLKETNGELAGVPAPSHRRNLSHRKAQQEPSSLSTTPGLGSYFSRSMNTPAQYPNAVRKTSPTSDEGAAVEGGNADDSKSVSTKNRNRRASEGSHLIKGDGKRAMAELRCDRCGKGYKHGSCLSKHMWEHDPAWAITSKLLISKHQQVQLLEAASVLVTMNHDPLPEVSPEAESEGSPASPGASSGVRDGISSTETTPPPMEDEADEDDDFEMSGMPASFAKRPSVSNASAYSRSYQSVPSSSFNGSAPLHSPAFSHFRHSSIDTRPSTADTRLHEDDEADLAAAIGLCNFGTPRTGPVPMSPDVPPVPPLPARYLDQSRSASVTHSTVLEQTSASGNDTQVGSTPNAFLSVSLNPSLSYKVSDEREVRMGDADRASRHRRNNDVDFGSRHGAVADDDDDGVFGHMEE